MIKLDVLRPFFLGPVGPPIERLCPILFSLRMMFVNFVAFRLVMICTSFGTALTFKILSGLKFRVPRSM